jgi:uncharacterized membrane protein
MKLNANLVKSTVVAALGGLLFGFDTAVIAGTTHALTVTFQLSPAALGMTVAAALWGTILGAMFAGICVVYVHPEINTGDATVCGSWSCYT